MVNFLSFHTGAWTRKSYQWHALSLTLTTVAQNFWPISILWFILDTVTKGSVQGKSYSSLFWPQTLSSLIVSLMSQDPGTGCLSRVPDCTALGSAAESHWACCGSRIESEAAGLMRVKLEIDACPLLYLPRLAGRLKPHGADSWPKVSHGSMRAGCAHCLKIMLKKKGK